MSDKKLSVFEDRINGRVIRGYKPVDSGNPISMLFDV